VDLPDGAIGVISQPRALHPVPGGGVPDPGTATVPVHRSPAEALRWLARNWDDLPGHARELALLDRTAPDLVKDAREYLFDLFRHSLDLLDRLDRKPWAENISSAGTMLDLFGTDDEGEAYRRTEGDLLHAEAQLLGVVDGAA
jgi:hypothetical protein